MRRVIKAFPLELIIWILAFVVLYNLNTDNSSICPIHNLGFRWCPGCGLGRAIHLVLHGEIKDSFVFHWMGVPTVFVLSFRIYQLLTIYIKTLNNKNDKH